MKPKQLSLLKKEKSAYGGDLRNTRKGRAGARPLATRETMHLVLRSSKACGEWSFLKAKNNRIVRAIIEKFSVVYGVRVISLANVGNHLHLQIQLGNRHTYRPFIRAITGAIAMKITGRTRWAKAATPRSVKAQENIANQRGRDDQAAKPSSKEKFWDYRPFTRIVQSLRAVLNLKDYIRINELEGQGYFRSEARFLIEIDRSRRRALRATVARSNVPQASRDKGLRHV